MTHEQVGEFVVRIFDTQRVEVEQVAAARRELDDVIVEDASPRAHNRALVKAQQVETALGALMRRLSKSSGWALGRTRRQPGKPDDYLEAYQA
ncbi:MAG: hypothetical protein V4595_02580 [Pseudomonadota bacterium]